MKDGEMSLSMAQLNRRRGGSSVIGKTLTGTAQGEFSPSVSEPVCLLSLSKALDTVMAHALEKHQCGSGLEGWVSFLVRWDIISRDKTVQGLAAAVAFRTVTLLHVSY